MAVDKDWGRWSNIQSLGEGGQGHTFLVEDKGAPGVLFVLKRLKNPDRIGRFRDEVRAGLALDHPNVVKVVDHDLETSKPWFVMEYCARGSLQYQPTRPLLDRVALFLAICDAVAYAHARGVVHRDIKPENVFIRADGTPAVGDFGLCLFLDGRERFTFSHEAVGPRWYMAPELEDGRTDGVSPRSDVYSLGKLFYWMLTGNTFAREKHRETTFDITAGARASEPYLIYELLDRMIVQDPAARLADGGQVALAVAQLRRRIGMGAHAIGRGIPQPCSYCGLGQYQIAVHPGGKGRSESGKYWDDVKNFGLPVVGTSQWIALVCDHCGNVQTFRLDYVNDPEFWTR